MEATGASLPLDFLTVSMGEEDERLYTGAAPFWGGELSTGSIELTERSTGSAWAMVAGQKCSTQATSGGWVYYQGIAKCWRTMVDVGSRDGQSSCKRSK